MRAAYRTAVACAVLLVGAALGSVLAHYGHVTDTEGKPLVGARVCYVVAGGGEAFCAETDKAGYYNLPSSKLPTIRISADGYLAVNVPAVPRDVPVRLRRAASLRVTLLDAGSDAPVSPAEIFITRPSGKRLGPLPTGNAGVMRFRTLSPGPIQLSATAEGYEEASGVALELVAGEESDVVIRLIPVAADPSG